METAWQLYPATHDIFNPQINKQPIHINSHDDNIFMWESTSIAINRISSVNRLLQIKELLSMTSLHYIAKTPKFQICSG